MLERLKIQLILKNSMNRRDRNRALFIKISHWEYWPWQFVYVPIFLQYGWQSIKYGSFAYPTIINRPYMDFGGIVEESKWDMYLRGPKQNVPKTALLPLTKDKNELKEFLQKQDLHFPLIVKPDLGMRGKGIQKIYSIEELLEFNPDPKFKFLIQEFLSYSKEIGLFIFKNPKSENWEISSIMERSFPIIIGNGKNTIEELIRENSRTFLQLERWKKLKRFQFDKILEDGEKLKLDHIGNHRLGTKFMDAQERNNTSLLKSMGDYCDQIDGLEYGRLDIVFNSWEELSAGENFSVIEINGANAEPSHIYDPKHSIFYAWNKLHYHFKMQYLLAKKARKNGRKAVSQAKAWSLLGGYKHTMNDLD